MSSDSHRATVYAGPSATDYVRAGKGATVLLLARHAPHPLFATLVAHFRVIAPEPPHRIASHEHGWGSAQPFASWLRGFLDGLGLSRVSLVADESFGLRALHFCLTEPMSVERIALLVRGVADSAVSAVGGSARHGHSGHPLLIRSDTEDGDTTLSADIVRFLSGAVGAGA